MPVSDIVIQGAREHNLRDVNLVLPCNQLICLTGVSGSGKSSLAFDTLFAEGQRRYVESLSSFARQFLGQMPKPDVDLIAGLRPSISISQKSTGTNPRSTVGTITEIYDFLRVLFARVGDGFCPKCGKGIQSQSREQIVARILQLPDKTRFTLLAPIVRGQKGEHRDLCDDLLKQGFVRARIDGAVHSLSDDLQLDRRMRHDIEVVIDRLAIKPGLRTRLAESVELALKIGKGTAVVEVESDETAPNRKQLRLPDLEGADEPGDEDEAQEAGRRARPRASSRPSAPSNRDIVFSVDYSCADCGISFEPPSPQLFSFNSPQGMCATCDGLGQLFSFDPGLLIPDASRTFKQGAIELVGAWKEMGRWRRHIHQGVADTLERKLDLFPGTMLETPWRELRADLQQLWLHGTGDEHITFTWRGGASPIKYGGKFDGVIPELLAKYRNSKSKPQIRQLEKYMRTMGCPSCGGERLNGQARGVKLTSGQRRFADRPTLSLPEVCGLSIGDAAEFFDDIRLDDTRALIAEEALKEIRGRLGFLMNVGLDYLTLDRTAPTLSGGESQRIRLAGQIGSGLVGVLYILDEPSIGLHPRDNDRLLDTLARLRDMGNTVVVVEHDEDTMRAADTIIDFGPGPGVRGGEVVAVGSADDIAAERRSVTGQFLAGKERIEIPAQRRLFPDSAEPRNVLRVLGATHNNLKNIDVEIPLGAFVCVTGVSGSGKSSLVTDILVEALRRDLNGGEGSPGEHAAIEGLEHLDKLIAIDQSPIGRTPRSNPGTYIKVFDDIRSLYTQLPDAKRRGFKPGRFSFNVVGGRCEACEGNGSNRLEMDFLADVWVTCPVCEGHRYNRETLQVKFKDRSIAEVLEMDVQQALDLFENVPAVRHKLQTLHDVGLDYLKLGQPSPTLSGGEAQRIKLARELVKKSTGRTLYLLDEPTTGLHFADIRLLLKVLHDFADKGNTVLVVEHNLDVIKTADWIIDLGPEGGAAGGRIVAVGTPEAIADHPDSHTGRALASLFARERTGGQSGGNGSRRAASAANAARNGEANGRSGGRAASSRSGRAQLATQITVQNARQHNLKGVNVAIDRDRMTVFCGPSGSGKSSLAMDTIYAEGQRRYVESLSSYARQFVSQMQKPAVDHIDGLSPAIAIEQKNLGHTPRSTVGTVTEIYDYLRILFARLGTPHCPRCDCSVGTQTADEITDKIMSHGDGARLMLCAPIEINVGEKYDTYWNELRAGGYARVRIDGQTHSLDSPPEIDRRRKHDVEVVVDRIVVKAASRSRIADSVENTLALGRGVLHVVYPRDDAPESRWDRVVHSQHLACERCGRSFEPLTPHNFSFNSQLGWCPACEGLGTQVGANPAALLRDPKWTLAAGAVSLWPDLSQPIARAMLESMAAATGLPLDVPFDQLAARHRRLIMHGAADDWFSVDAGGVSFRFQFKGLYPGLEEASRLSPSLRNRLEQFVGEVECSTCSGSRLRDDASAFRFRDRTIDELGLLPLGSLQQEIAGWKLSPRDRRVAGELLREITGRVQFLNDVGLEYLTLSRGAATLSNGEAQRIRLASQLGSGLCGVLYVLDEPTIGLHPRDNTRLLGALHKLRDLGNTLVVVEHDREVIEGADAICDFGPAAGKLGGEVVAQAIPAQLARRRGSVTGPYLSGKKSIPIPKNRRPVTIDGAVGHTTQKTGAATSTTKSAKSRGKTSDGSSASTARGTSAASPGGKTLVEDRLEIRGARHRNLRSIDVAIPLGTFTAVTGPSGSGKSSLVNDVLYASLARTLHRAGVTPGAHDELRGIEQINKVIRVDQTPLGNSPSSNPATYTGVFDKIRELFAQLPESKVRGYSSRRFSFNVPGGRCEQCEGNGQKCIEMHFLPDVWVECEECRGKRYNAETLAVQFHGHSIADVLEMTCGEALKLFENIPPVRRILKTLCDVGLDYLTLGQSAPTLSGGEAQRVKLAAELARPATGRTLYLLDEPTTGLHFDDLARLLDVMHRLVDRGNTVVVIEHNLDVIKQADWVIDMGPEAGEAGGEVVVAGTPEQVVEYAMSRNPVGKSAGRTKRASAKKNSSSTNDGPRSYTGEALAPVLQAGPYEIRQGHAADDDDDAGEAEKFRLANIGGDVAMPWEKNGRRWHTEDRVGRKGEPCQWDGRILAHVVDRIHELGRFSETNWNARSVVEIAAETKSHGWFLHAITGEAWMLKLKFRVPQGTFQQAKLRAALPLKTLNELDEVPLYSNEPRVKVKSMRGPLQEVELRLHSYDEIDRPAFADFLEQAVEAFQRFAGDAPKTLEDHMPWKKLGQRWHFMRKGFPTGRRVEWETAVLEELCELLKDTAPSGQFLWNNQQLVHLFVPGQKEPWASLHTKRSASLDLTLTGPKNRIGFGRVADLAADRAFDDSSPQRDLIQLRFRSVEDLHRGDLAAFLREHLGGVESGK